MFNNSARRYDAYWAFFASGIALVLLGVGWGAFDLWGTEWLTTLLIMTGAAMLFIGLTGPFIYGTRPKPDELFRKQVRKSSAFGFWFTFLTLLALGAVNLLWRPVQFDVAFLLLLAAMSASNVFALVVLRRRPERL